MMMWLHRIKPFLTLGSVAVLALLVMTGGETFSDALRYDRQAVTDGEIWRLLTANVVHLGWPHFFMNFAGLILIAAVFGPNLTNIQWLVLAIVCSLVVCGGLFLFDTNLRWYVGLSGVLHGLFIAPLIVRIRSGWRFEWVLLAAVTGKLIWEQVTGPLPGSEDLAGGNVIVNSHLYGAIAGILPGLLFKHGPVSGNTAASD